MHNLSMDGDLWQCWKSIIHTALCLIHTGFKVLVAVGIACAQTSECAATNAVCDGGTCMCLAGYEQSTTSSDVGTANECMSSFFY